MVEDSPEFIKYGQSLNRMIERSKAFQQIFVEHLNTLCVKIETAEVSEKEKTEVEALMKTPTKYVYRLNPELTMDSLDKLVKDVRKDIVNSYLECQEDFNKLKERLFNIVIRKIRKLNEMREKKMEEELMK